MQQQFWPSTSWSTEWRDGRTWNLVAPITNTTLVCFEIGKYGDPPNSYMTTNEAEFKYTFSENIDLAEYIFGRIKQGVLQYDDPVCCVLQVKENNKIIKKYLLHDICVINFSTDGSDLGDFLFNVKFKDVSFIS